MAASTVDTTIQTLRDSLLDKAYLHEPWTSGVISLSQPEERLFYETEDGTPRSLKLGLNNTDDAQNLSEACQPATFGLNKEDVLDEAYRKAGKLDADKFVWRFNPSDKADFVIRLASGLFPWKTLDSGIRFEPYKLNVYGSESFFKAHKDTPRDQKMFGSLVVVLPVKHQGGELVLRHRGREFAFNGQALIKNAPSNSVAYVAFFSDVEHEVARVLSGYRVTVTYNLYFDSTKPTPSTRLPVDSRLEHPFKIELRRIKEDSVLRDAHPILGFGLEHAYPFETAIELPTALKLKGSDAVLTKVFNELGIDYDFFLLYRQDKDSDASPVCILSRNVIDGDEDYHNEEMVDKILTEEAWLVWRECPSEVVPEVSLGWHDCDFRYIATRQEPRSVPSLDIEWVTEPSEEHLDKSTALVYGNEVSLGYQYHQLCVIARFSPGPPFG